VERSALSWAISALVRAISASVGVRFAMLPCRRPGRIRSASMWATLLRRLLSSAGRRFVNLDIFFFGHGGTSCAGPKNWVVSVMLYLMRCGRGSRASRRPVIEKKWRYQNVSQEIEDPENDPRVKEVLQGSAARLILRMNGKPAPPPQTEADRLADEYMALQVAKATAPETRAREDVERMSADFEKRTGIRITGASPQLSEEEEVRNMVGVFTKRTGMCITGVNAPRTDEEAFKNLAEDFEKKFGLRVV